MWTVRRDPLDTYPKQQRPCYKSQFCPAWNEWESWGECSALCSTGKKIRHRSCKTGKPGFEGCPGPAEETTECNTAKCAAGQKRYTDENEYGMPRAPTKGLSLNPFHQECLDYHNFFRALHNLKPMKARVSEFFLWIFKRKIFKILQIYERAKVGSQIVSIGAELGKWTQTESTQYTQ